MDNSVRLLRPSDIGQAMLLTEAAGWNQTAPDWERFLELAPDGCFGIDCDGALAAAGGAVRYGENLAWIGMVLTLPAFRGRGFARRIMEHVLADLDQRGVECVKLDATDMGRPLYLSLGFEDECAIERWSGTCAKATAPPLAAGLAIDTLLDRQAFGADRAKLLDSLAVGEAVGLPEQGYAMGRPGRLGPYFGPCVARTPRAAGALAEWYLARHTQQTIFWDLFPEHVEARNLAQRFGFECRRRLTRMVRGKAAAWPAAYGQIYAIAGFEYG